VGVFSEGRKYVCSFGGVGYFPEAVEERLSLDLSGSLPLILYSWRSPSSISGFCGGIICTTLPTW